METARKAGGNGPVFTAAVLVAVEWSGFLFDGWCNVLGGKWPLLSSRGTA